MEFLILPILVLESSVLLCTEKFSTLCDNIGETCPLSIISVEGRGGFANESIEFQERAVG